MGKVTKFLLLVILFCMTILSENNVLQAQNDSFFYENIEDRDIEGYSSLMGDHVYMYSLFEENGFTFNGFGNGNSNDGFTFDDYDFAPDNAPLGNGLLLLSFGGVFYAFLGRNRKEE
jgi:hypothetical protein